MCNTHTYYVHVRWCYMNIYHIILCYITLEACGPVSRSSRMLYILQRGVQWKQGVVVYMTLYTSLLCNNTPIHCTPHPLHPTSAEYPVARACCFAICSSSPPPEDPWQLLKSAPCYSLWQLLQPWFWGSKSWELTVSLATPRNLSQFPRVRNSLHFRPRPSAPRSSAPEAKVWLDCEIGDCLVNTGSQPMISAGHFSERSNFQRRHWFLFIFRQGSLIHIHITIIIHIRHGFLFNAGSWLRSGKGFGCGTQSLCSPCQCPVSCFKIMSTDPNLTSSPSRDNKGSHPEGVWTVERGAPSLPD